MNEQQPHSQNQQQPSPQQPPPPYPPPGGYYDPAYVQAQYYQSQRWSMLERLTWKQKIILGAVLVLVVLTFGMWNSCHPARLDTARTTQQQPGAGVMPPNPESIESQREQAERELQQAKAQAEAAQQRLESGPVDAPTSQPARIGATAQQDPDAQFWRQVRLEKWKREQEAPYASGVGFVTRPEHRRNEPAATVQKMASSGAMNPASLPITTTAATPVQQPAAGSAKTAESAQNPEKYAFDHADGRLHRIDESTIIPATLLNQLDGEFAGPVICQISENIYDASGLNLLIPAGSKVLGEARAVNSNNQHRLAVVFHRITMPDGYSLSLDKFPALDQAGSTAMTGNVNHHYLQTFGASLAVGGIAGLAQIGNSASSYSPWYGFREGVSQQMAMSSQQVLDRYLNRYPTITIKPGSRAKIILMADLPDVPEYAHHAVPVNR